jgi:hypothetical protein
MSPRKSSYTPANGSSRFASSVRRALSYCFVSNWISASRMRAICFSSSSLARSSRTQRASRQRASVEQASNRVPRRARYRRSVTPVVSRFFAF